LKAVGKVVKGAKNAIRNAKHKLGKKGKTGKKSKADKKAPKKAAKKARRAAKKKARAAKKRARKNRRKAKKAKRRLAKAIRKAAKRAIRICKAKRPRLTGRKLKKCIERMKRAALRVLKKKLGLKRALRAVKRRPTRRNIQRAQKLLKRHRRGPVRMRVKQHQIRLRPALPRRKKQKKFEESKQLENYKIHLRKQAQQLKDQIKDLKLDLHALRSPEKKDWKIEYGYLDPPDESMAKLSARLQSDLKPFLKDAKSIKQGDLNNGRTQLVVMEKMRQKVIDKIDDAKRLPLLPEMYRFLG